MRDNEVQMHRPMGRGNARILMAAGFADALGSGVFVPLSVIYLTRVVCLSVAQVGAGLTVAGAAGVIGPFVASPLLDRVDARFVVIGCFCCSAVGFIAYLTVSSFSGFVIIAVIIQFAGRTERPSSALLAVRMNTGGDRIVALAWQQTVRNLGYGLGGLLSALVLIGRGSGPFHVAIIANAASYLLAGALITRLPQRGLFVLLARPRPAIEWCSTTRSSSSWPRSTSLLHCATACWSSGSPCG